MKFLGTLVVAALVGLSAIAVAKEPLVAQAVPATAKVKPSANDRNDPLASFVGDWDCKGTLYPADGGAHQPSHLLWTFERSTGGWLHLIAGQEPVAQGTTSDLMSGLQYMFQIPI